MLRPISIVVSVVGVHLALLWWTQVGQPYTPPQALPIRFQLSPEVPPKVKPVARSPMPTHHPPKKQSTRPIAKSEPPAIRISPVPAPANAAPAYNAAGLDIKPVDVAGIRAATTVGNAQRTDIPQVSAAPAARADAVQLPSSSAEYLNNPHPAYPVLSQRLGEQGKTVIRVLISKDGSALQGEVILSSGFERLDQVALHTVLAWRYVPGHHNGQAQDMWFNVPINFKLN